MIKLRQVEGKWELTIVDEIFKFQSKKEMLKEFNSLIELKDKYRKW